MASQEEAPHVEPAPSHVEPPQEELATSQEELAPSHVEPASQEEPAPSHVEPPHVGPAPSHVEPASQEEEMYVEGRFEGTLRRSRPCLVLKGRFMQSFRNKARTPRFDLRGVRKIFVRKTSAMFGVLNNKEYRVLASKTSWWKITKEQAEAVRSPSEEEEEEEDDGQDVEPKENAEEDEVIGDQETQAMDP